MDKGVEEAGQRRRGKSSKMHPTIGSLLPDPINKLEDKLCLGVIPT
jgi:hypothetical protein